MSNSQQPERYPGGKDAAPDPDVVDRVSGRGGIHPVPDENRPSGSHEADQDKPDLDEFVEAMSTPKREVFEASSGHLLSKVHQHVTDLTGGRSVTVDGDEVQIVHGPWTFTTTVDNVASCEPELVGPALRITPTVLAGTGWFSAQRHAVRLRFSEPVVGVEPTGTVRIAELVVDVDDPDALIERLAG